MLLINRSQQCSAIVRSLVARRRGAHDVVARSLTAHCLVDKTDVTATHATIYSSDSEFVLVRHFYTVYSSVVNSSNYTGVRHTRSGAHYCVPTIQSRLR